MNRHMLQLAWLIALLVSVVGAAEITVKVSDIPLFTLDERLFGQMMERAGVREPGPEAGLEPGTRRLRADIVKALKASRISVLRFPGGSIVDQTEWCDLIDHAPGRGSDRPQPASGTEDPAGNNFGYDECLQICSEIGAQPLFVVNFFDGLLKKKTLTEAAGHAADLVAYCNLPLDAPKAKSERLAYAKARAANGHPEPWGVRLFQIGNETWFAWEQLAKLGMDREQSAQWYVDCLAAYVEAMRAVDPGIEIIADAPPADLLVTRIKARLGNKIDYLVGEHIYTPFGSYHNVSLNGKQVPAESLSAEETWYAWTGYPFIDPETGFSVIQSKMWDPLRAAGYKGACTEWNSNSWGQSGAPKLALQSSYARGIAAAGDLHALLRAGKLIRIATKSMCVGSRWKNLCSVWVDPKGVIPPHMKPSGSILSFYGQHHGSEMLAIKATEIPRRPQPYLIAGYPAPSSPVALIDVLATRDERRIFVHLINRTFADDLPVRIDLSAFTKLGEEAQWHLLTGRLNDRPEAGEANEIVSFTQQALAVKDMKLTLPRRSISIVEIAVSH
ncbi:MAG: hypothetical protein HQL31_03125 [Planctomycetes bacterium]|nr:hypothetical protein [Planctomycetota bacterium]